ncbi:helix-turn-helix domain-containing protein [Yersinia enterocolitica]|uniref:helix-turn-helix domain-containing protein n=1 Tax=Yersinia enterocolitica TaxID=630 RepID=UPI001C60FBC1|nr:XRE family transcriptional regulator [Yersinia enterocolitica]MBW5823087.1 ImmA/IrrE family metallo-endopeptidase [Yersinia enterocolitica]MBW5879080.1 ImmA/IrrE family metallo-endopeptidase [Yersinia enterocolitica]
MNIQQRIAERLVQARNDAGMSAIAVADAIGVVRQTYSKFEQAQGVPSVTQLIMLCKIFDKPIGYFYEQDDGEFRFAMRADSPDLLDAKLRNELIEKLKNINAIEEAAEASLPEDLPNSIPIFTAKEEDLRRVEDKAMEERFRLGIGNATCVGDIVAILEASDIRVIPFNRAESDDGKGMVFGFSAFSNKYGTAIYVNIHDNISVERQIFSICHEYAHLIFHREEYDGPAKSYKTKGRATSPEEKVANHFAACFLVPESALRKQFVMQGGGWAYEETVLRLKSIFRVSATCIIDRLSKCKLINPRNTKYLWVTANRKGWLKHEPNPIREQLNYKGRLTVLSRKAWEAGSASETFISELLELNRKELGSLLDEWYDEQEAGEDAI